MRLLRCFGALGVICVGLVACAGACASLEGLASNGGLPSGDGAPDAAGDGAQGAADAPGDALTEVPGTPLGAVVTALPIEADVTTLAGSGTAAFADGTGAAASFKGPYGVTVSAAGIVYVGDTGNHRIRAVTPAGVVTTVAGSGMPAFAEGTGIAASFTLPIGVAVDGNGNVYVGDASNQRVRKVTTPAGVVTTLAGSGTATFADGTGAGASFDNPYSVAVDGAGNVYVADRFNHRIRAVTPAGVVTTLAGTDQSVFLDGPTSAATFEGPNCVGSSPTGNLWIPDSDRIRTLIAGEVKTVAGSATQAFADGTGAAASFNVPNGVAVDAAGNAYVADTFNERIRKVTPLGVVTTLAGSGMAAFADGKGAAASFNTPVGVAVDTAGNVYVADRDNHRIRKLTPVGAGQLAVKWSPPVTEGSSPITGYVASATAAGQATQTCTTTGLLSCTISGLTSGVAYAVSITATNAVGTSPPSPSLTATPN